MVCQNTMASLNKTEHKNIGVYVLCRILPNGEADYFRREAEWLGTRNIRPDQKNITLYTDEVRIGEKNNHTNLDRLIEDAVAGKVDHIIIANVLDLWRSPQKIFDTVQKLKQLNRHTSPQGGREEVENAENMAIHECRELSRSDVTGRKNEGILRDKQY